MLVFVPFEFMALASCHSVTLLSFEIYTCVAFIMSRFVC